MKKISLEQSNLILAVTAEGNTKLPPAALEKNIHLTDLLNQLFGVFDSEYTLIFCGGTSLSKCHGAIQRMSEDLDFKILELNPSSPLMKKSALSDLKLRIQNALVDLDFKILTSGADNNNRHFWFDLAYRGTFDVTASLRDAVKIEFTVANVFHELVELPIQTLLYAALGLKESNAVVSCLSLEQTVAEKVLAFLRKSIDTLNDDERIVRHVYDVHKLRDLNINLDEVSKCFQHAYLEDLERYPKMAKISSLDFITNSLNRIEKECDFENEFKKFVLELTYGDEVDYKTNMASYLRMAHEIKQRLVP
jgi:predicted nucleotidyltransferase component of viral defense system